MRKITLILRYTIFALISTCANLFMQWFSIRILSGQYSLYISILAGTAVGLVLKYYLDKRYIFHYYTKSKTHDFKKFLIYTFTGTETTAIFWSFELGFNYLFKEEFARYTGAAIGLSIGYAMKYFLDKTFVFKADN